MTRKLVMLGLTDEHEVGSIIRVGSEVSVRISRGLTHAEATARAPEFVKTLFACPSFGPQTFFIEGEVVRD